VTPGLGAVCPRRPSLTRLTRLLAAGCLATLLTPVSAAGQEAIADAQKIRLGPLGLTPTISLTNVGIDTNVLNQSTNPQRDFTTTFVPGLTSSLRIGRGLLTSKTGLEFSYFAKVASQRSVGVGEEGRFDLALNQVTPHLNAGYVQTNQRPNAEIDARVGQTTTSFGLGANLHLGWRAGLDMTAGRRRLEFEDVRYEGVNLAHQLDRSTTEINANLKVELTPLTTLVVKNSVQQDRFTFSPQRDTDSVSVVPGFEFKPSAIVSGTAFVGFRALRPQHFSGPSFTGVVSAVALSYTARDATRMDVKVDRNIDYSFEPEQPYFLATGANLSLTQALTGRWDVVGRIGRVNLDYRNQQVMPVNRRDRVSTYGTGLGYRLDFSARIGFDVVHVERLSPLPGRQYSGFQFGGSFRYGF
jgi:Putative beta-barrel porin 2